VPYDWSTYATGIFAVLALVAAAALLGWLAARLFLHATRSRADTADRTDLG
jgi:HAMP domain-containing protein